jgi:hypothetical protein
MSLLTLWAFIACYRGNFRVSNTVEHSFTPLSGVQLSPITNFLKIQQTSESHCLGHRLTEERILSVRRSFLLRKEMLLTVYLERQ